MCKQNFTTMAKNTDSTKKLDVSLDNIESLSERDEGESEFKQ